MHQAKRASSKLAVWLAAMSVFMFVGCGGPDKARLTVTINSYEGGGETVIEYSGPGGKAEQMVKWFFNGSTGESNYEGDFAEVYAALAGKEHLSPRSITEVGQVLDGAEVGKWSVVEDTETEEKVKNAFGSFITVREIHLLREKTDSGETK